MILPLKVLDTSIGKSPRTSKEYIKLELEVDLSLFKPGLTSKVYDYVPIEGDRLDKLVAMLGESPCGNFETWIGRELKGEVRTRETRFGNQLYVLQYHPYGE